MLQHHITEESPLLTLHECAALVERGYAYVNASVFGLIDCADYFAEFLYEKDDGIKAQWTFAVDDPYDPDDGLVRKNATDQKFFFHWSPQLIPLIDGRKYLSLTDTDIRFLHAQSRVYRQSALIARRVAESLDVFFGGSYQLARLLQDCVQQPAATSRSKLRINRYDSGTDGRVHRDRSFLTLHHYEEGGRFFVCNDREGSEKIYLAPMLGKTLVFFGLKAEQVTNKLCRARWHGTEGESGRLRSSIVYFSHINHFLPDSWTYPS